MIRIGETHEVCEPLHSNLLGQFWCPRKDANDAVKRLVEAVEAEIKFFGGSTELRAAVAPFTDTDASLVDSGLRSCATPETEETGR